MTNLTIEPLRKWMSQKYKLCYLKCFYLGGFSQKLQTGLLKMHIHSLPVGGAFGMSEIYETVSVWGSAPGNGCKQSSARLIK